AAVPLFNFHYNSGGIGKVVLYEKNSEMGFDIPHFPKANQSFAPDDGFSVGAIKRYLENMGGEVQSLNSTSPGELKDALKGANILILMNLKKELPSTDIESIRDYVKNGGGLLVFAEHTSMFVQDRDFASGRDYLNDLLEPTGIKINPDTADYVQNHWLYAVSALPHPITRDLNFDLTTSSVGASLYLSGSARPLLIGRFAFSDSANQTTPGHLGDRLYEPGEALGDLVIAACDTYGKGKVLVFGDTSCIFNNELPFRYQLIYNSASWLTGGKSDLVDYQYLASALILLLGLAAYFFAGRYQSGLSLLLLICIALSAALSLGLAASINDSRTAALEEPQEEVAWIDFTHLNQFNSENYRDDGVAGLTENLFRNDYLPQVLQKNQDISRILKGSAAIIIAPNEDYTAKEAQQIQQFVNSGGLLILCAGYKSAGPLSPILKSFGLEIAGTPLGSFPWIEETHATGGQAIVTPENLRLYWHKPKFMEAYPVRADGDYTPITWMRYNGVVYNLIIQKKAGLGNVVLIGDSRFLLNENLEHLSQGEGKENREQYQLQWLGNIELLRKILAIERAGMT
ncbi:MAG TPA: Gldg family protein, partial [Methanothrix soehngenii]|nr:Gldg family protein [Methanothrix soehngenii]